MRYLDSTVYNRLFTKILDSSIWLEPSTTRIVWITLLAAMDEDGYAHFSAIENLASRARVTTEEAQKAVECFLAPDPNSENTDHEGRRVERVPGGFLILNAEHHRKLLNREIRREQTRLRVQKHRVRTGNKSCVTPALPNVTLASASDNASESEWIKELSTDKAFEGIDVQKEYYKAVRWHKEHNRQVTRRSFINWLNRADKTLKGTDGTKADTRRDSERSREYRGESEQGGLPRLI